MINFERPVTEMSLSIGKSTHIAVLLEHPWSPERKCLVARGIERNSMYPIFDGKTENRPEAERA